MGLRIGIVWWPHHQVDETQSKAVFCWHWLYCARCLFTWRGIGVDTRPDCRTIHASPDTIEEHTGGRKVHHSWRVNFRCAWMRCDISARLSSASLLGPCARAWRHNDAPHPGWRGPRRTQLRRLPRRRRPRPWRPCSSTFPDRMMSLCHDCVIS